MITEEHEHTRPDGSTDIFARAGDFCFRKDFVANLMPAKDLAEQMEWIKGTRLRDDDVIICAYPKSGTHWLWEILMMLRRGRAEYNVNVKESAMMEFRTRQAIAAITSPRVLNSHVTSMFVPSDLKTTNAKLIHLMRNPKDVAVSFNCHINRMEPPDKQVSISHFLKLFMSPLAMPSPFFEYVKKYEDFRKDNPESVLNVFFEDLKKRPEEEIKRIAAFIGETPDKTLIKDIAIKCDFDKLKSNAVARDLANVSSVKKQNIYRKGVVGDWKNHFSEEDNQTFDAYIDRESKGLDLKFQYEWRPSVLI